MVFKKYLIANSRHLVGSVSGQLHSLRHAMRSIPTASKPDHYTVILPACHSTQPLGTGIKLQVPLALCIKHWHTHTDRSPMSGDRMWMLKKTFLWIFTKVSLVNEWCESAERQKSTPSQDSALRRNKSRCCTEHIESYLHRTVYRFNTLPEQNADL